MSAAPTLREVADAVAEARLEAILIGNAGAALLGARVTTDDFDFMIRNTPNSMRKLRVVARQPSFFSKKELVYFVSP